MSLVTSPQTRQRLFAIIQIFGQQKKITPGDLVLVERDIPLECGQQLLLSKCLVIGGKDFSLIGRPVLDKEMFRIPATVVEKTMTDIRCQYRHVPRSRNWKKYMFHTSPQTVLRINDIELLKHD